MFKCLSVKINIVLDNWCEDRSEKNTKRHEIDANLDVELQIVKRMYTYTHTPIYIYI